MTKRTPTIVVIDDSATSLSLYRRSAAGLPVELAAFQSPLDSLAYLRDHAADLVFLDILMGEKDGWAVLRELRGFDQHHDTVVVIVTSKDYDQDRALAKALGAQQYLVKPLRSQEIREIIERFIGDGGEADGGDA